jgi:hypothetical protein
VKIRTNAANNLAFQVKTSKRLPSLEPPIGMPNVLRPIPCVPKGAATNHDG